MKHSKNNYKFFIISLLFLSLASCRKDTPVNSATTDAVDQNTQNAYDDAAIKQFLQDNYLNSKGLITQFSSTDTSDDNYKKLADMNPVTLADGVVYIVREGAQPNPGTSINATDVIRILQRSITYIATNSGNTTSFTSPLLFRDDINGIGVPEVDPAYYYFPQSKIDIYNSNNKTSYTESYFQIEGFNEALQKFKAYDIPDSDNYNLQGVIIVPSRKAFARDPHFTYTNYSFRNRSFIFNFQVYKTTPR